MDLRCTFSTRGCSYWCSVDIASITDFGTSVKSFIGDHCSGKTDKDVGCIQFNNTTVEYFPRGLHKIFPNLKTLEIFKCGLKSITREDLAGLENLETLNLWGNNLKSLPSDLLIGFSKLKNISFRRNKLEFLSSKLLEPIAGYKPLDVDFTINTKIDAYFSFYLLDDVEWSTRLHSAYDIPYSVESLEALMEIIDSQCDPPESEADRKFLSQLRAKTSALWSSGDLSDFTIIGGRSGSSKEFKVHKTVLGMQSAVFAAAMTTEMKEKQSGIMEIDDFRADVVEGFLHFLYTGVVQDESTALDLYALAARFEVDLLMEQAESVILKNIEELNAFEVFQIGHLYNKELIKKAAFDAIKKMFPRQEIPETLMEDPERIQILVEAHGKILQVLAKKQ